VAAGYAVVAVGYAVVAVDGYGVVPGYAVVVCG
jgi:hypothetical protein